MDPQGGRSARISGISQPEFPEARMRMNDRCRCA
jgi:hypothetical protein